jgi:hypothetical protein
MLANDIHRTLTFHNLRVTALHACPKCHRTVDETRFSLGDACPSCGTAIVSNEDWPWTNVARLANLAEAGFLTDELIGLGIDAQVHQLNDFSALTDRWESQYLIRVPTEEADRAADRIRQHIADEAGQEDASPARRRWVTADQTLEPLLWRPIALVILAGVSSFVLGQKFSELQGVKADRRPERNSLATAMESIDRPFVTEPAGGEPRHRIQYDRRRSSWLLETDRDGDGHYDSRQALRANGANW